MPRTLSEEARRRYGPGDLFVLWRGAGAETGAERFARVSFRWEEAAAEILEQLAGRDPAAAEELEETAKLWFLLRGETTRFLDVSEVAELRARFPS